MRVEAANSNDLFFLHFAEVRLRVVDRKPFLVQSNYFIDVLRLNGPKQDPVMTEVPLFNKLPYDVV
jgi:hypothetical protein